MGKIVLGVFIGVIIVVGIMALANSHVGHSDAIADRASEIPPARVSAYQLWMQYQNNELGADATYKGKPVLIRGAALGVKKNIDGDYYVAFATGNELEPVAAFLDRSSLQQASQIHGATGWWGVSVLAGQVVSLRCIGDGMELGTPILRHCEMIPTEPNAVPYWKPETAMQSQPASNRADTNFADTTQAQGAPACNEADSLPKMLVTPPAKFTTEAATNHIQGTVVVGITVDESGSIKDAHVIKSLGYGLDESALAAVQQYKFAPAQKQCQPVSAAITIEVGFP